MFTFENKKNRVALCNRVRSVSALIMLLIKKFALVCRHWKTTQKLTAINGAATVFPSLPGALVSFFANFVICVIFRDFLILCECEQFAKSKSDITHHSEYFYVMDGLTIWNI